MSAVVKQNKEDMTSTRE